MKNSEKKEKRLALPFFIVLALAAVIALILPLRPEVSERERRSLTPFPAFTWESFWRGDYLRDVGLWYSDTFPGRDEWLAGAGALQNLQGITDTAVNLDMLRPGREDSTDLDALLSAPPDPPVPEVTAPPAATPAPTEEPWAGFGPEEERELYGASILIDGGVFTRLGFDQTAADNHIRMVSAFADALAAEGIRFFDLPVPTGAGVLLSPELSAELGCADQGKILAYLFSRTGENVIGVDALGELLAHNREYLYFRSDHHWTALGAWYAYDAFCAAAGWKSVPLTEYTGADMGTYTGSFYLTLGQNAALRPDTVMAFVPPGNITMDIPGSTDPRNGTWGPVVDYSAEPENMKYLCFIAGDHPVTVLTNHDLPDGPDCVVLKDSFANPFVIYLTEHYRTVHVLDYRSFRTSVRSYALEAGAEDVILCQDISISQSLPPQTLLPANLQ